MNDMNSLTHTTWNCKYHIVFAPKYRRKVFYGEKRREVGEILRTLCNWKKIKIIEAEVMSGSCTYARRKFHRRLQYPVSWDTSRGKAA